jgi:predicted transcriptional regulator
LQCSFRTFSFLFIVSIDPNRLHASATDHKSSQYAKIKEDISSASSKISVTDIERENRLSKVISLYSKGLNQEEIAQELHVDQSTVSRDLQYITHEARIKIEKYLRDDILFEYVRYMVGSNEITRHLWDIVQNSDTTTKEKTNALSCLMQSYNSRLQTLTSGPESFMNIKKSLSEIDLQRVVDSSPVLKAQVNQRKLFKKW